MFFAGYSGGLISNLLYPFCGIKIIQRTADIYIVDGNIMLQLSWRSCFFQKCVYKVGRGVVELPQGE